MILRSSLLCLVMVIYAEDIGCALPSHDLGAMIGEVRESLREVCKRSVGSEDVESVIRSVFMPHVDSSMITKQVLGRKYWFDASEADRNKLQELLEVLLIRQYAGAFNCEYVDSRVDIYPVRGEIKRYSKVDSSVFLVGANPIQVKYAVRCDSAEWKVVDIVVDGLSIAQTYRSQFNRLLSQGGVAKLNSYLESKLLNKDDL